MAANSEWSHADVPDLDGKVAVITGANSGIGYETAKTLAEHGADVVLACRSTKRGNDAVERIRKAVPQAKARFATLDLGNLASVRSFTEAFGAESPSLDILCNNAGVMACPHAETVDGFEMQFGTNHLGHFALTGLLMGRIRATPGARVVVVSSLYHKMGRIDFDNLNAERSYDRTKAYQQSKLANLLFAFELERRFDQSGVDAIAVAAHPGWTATHLQRDSQLLRALNPFFAQQPPEGALPTLYAATAPDVRGGEYFGPGGWFEVNGAPRRVAPSGRARDPRVARRLWEVSEKLTGVSYDL